jgi:NAD(P)-dependent dehydrogenase (short-subunit alcohol dehydrogenase family)
MLIATGTLTRQSLAGQVAVVTGAGGGIGFEAARVLIWLGARVVIAELSDIGGLECSLASADGVGYNEVDAPMEGIVFSTARTSGASS